MAVDNLVDSAQLDADLTSVANAIRTKGGTSGQLAFPAEFVSAIEAIETGGGGFDLDAYVQSSPTAPAGDITLTTTHIRDYALAYLEGNPAFSLYGPNVTYIGQNAFRQCRMLTKARFPRLTSHHNTTYIFYMPTSGTRSLQLIDWGLDNVPGNWVVNCVNLKTIILRKTTVATLSNTSAIAGTPFKSGDTGGTIYIPKALYDHLGDGSSSDYKAATNWSTVDEYGTITWAQLEGSIYEDPDGDW